MKIQFLTLFLIVSLTGPAWARLGETEDQLIARYGDPTNKGSGGPVGEKTSWIHFKKSGFDIEVILFNGVSSQEHITNSQGDGMTTQEIKTLLDANAQGHAWKELSGGQNWQRDDGALASINGSGLLFQSKELIDAEAAAYKAAHARSLEGF
jgi:hypothetical protein